ncbi:serine-rich adhesin for platelets-like [Macrosteles quadrilineatus]|uniref:serine-rich adhesin for platelets-like n=1 Tax=Macrosteles quadrilineatus TaxID=74068 RepID=UPI0023E0EB24|nr:serine-rich adhesin for platelets-like [Macrosteles quadrilineatus]
MERSSVLRENRQRPRAPPSPLMFESDEDPEEEDLANNSNKENAEESVVELNKEEKILKGFQTVLMGIPPPPAFTVPQLDCREILKLWRENQSFRVTLSPEKRENNTSMCKQEENVAKATKWPETLQLDYWDVYYNKSSASEELERLSIRYKERYVGVETSSCVNALFAKSPLCTASARKRARHRAWGHSPGRRLSHLARRRKAFSSANLCSVAGNKNPDKKMIMVEIKKLGNRQKKKGSVKKTKPTPKKKSETQSSNYKRALFQSPDQDPTSKTPNTHCVQRSKRNLFAESSEKKNQFGKRERPMPKRVSPRKRVNRSLSFQESLQPSAPPRVPPPKPPPTANQPQPLSGTHKQKMLWAATNALREEGIRMSHELFRPCMTVLFRTCHRLWLTRFGADLHDGEGSTSERMLALAKQFSSYTVREIGSDPTSEHMALVYNNSLKMAETIFNQPSSSGVSKVSKNISSDLNVNSKTTKLYMKEIDTDKPVLGSNRIANVEMNNKVVDRADSSVKAKAKSKTRTPSKSDSARENASREVSNLQVCNAQTIVKNTPSKVICRDSPRSSPRFAKRLLGDAKVKNAVCNALFRTESKDHPETTTESGVQNYLTSPKDEKPESGLSSQLSSQRETPLKSALTARGTPKRTCTIRELSVSNSIASVSSSPITQHDAKQTLIQAEESCRLKVVVPRLNLEEGNTGLCGISRQCPVVNKGSPAEKEQYTRQDTQTPSKKVSFRTVSPLKSCQVNLIKHSSEANTNNVPSPSGGQNGSEANSSSSSVLETTTASSFASYQITESSGGRRITRSVSTDTKVIGNKPIHHLFSPPTTQTAKLYSNKLSSEKLAKKVDSNDPLISPEAHNTLQNGSDGEHLMSLGPRLKRRVSNGLKTKISQDSEPGAEVKVHVENQVEQTDSVDLQPSQRSLRSTKSPKKKTTCRQISQDAESTGSASSSQSKAEHSEPLPDSPEFLSPQTRSRKAKSTKSVSSNDSQAKLTPNKSKNVTNTVSPGIQLTKAISNRRASVLSSESSSFKDTPDKSVFSEEYSADTENSSGTPISGKLYSVKSNFSVKTDGENETNKENKIKEQICGDKSVERQTSHRQLLSVENTPVNQVVAEEPVNRMLQLYRLSTSGGDDEKLLPNIVCLEPPKLEPHWAADEGEVEDSTSPPSLAPHWEQESCSGTSTSLPESIMEHWHQLSAKVAGQSTDKVMFDFEDTSYEITFPSANEDSRASSICAPFDCPFVIDDSKSGFHNVFRRSSTESSN